MKKFIPKGYHSITPYLIVKNSNQATHFYETVFSATEASQYLDEGSGRICHARVKIGDSYIMFADECTELDLFSPKRSGNSPVGICVYVEDVEAVLKKAVEAGAKILRPVKVQFHGDKNAEIEDPFGHRWTISTHLEDVPHDELHKRATVYFSDEMKNLKKK